MKSAFVVAGFLCLLMFGFGLRADSFSADDISSGSFDTFRVGLIKAMTSSELQSLPPSTSGEISAWVSANRGRLDQSKLLEELEKKLEAVRKILEKKATRDVLLTDPYWKKRVSELDGLLAVQADEEGRLVLESTISELKRNSRFLDEKLTELARKQVPLEKLNEQLDLLASSESQVYQEYLSTKKLRSPKGMGAAAERWALESGRPMHQIQTFFREKELFKKALLKGIECNSSACKEHLIKAKHYYSVQ